MARKRQQQAGGPGEISGLRDLSPIGRGASSTVYRAHDEELNRWVAVKVFEADDPSDPARKRFRREREITANLGKHPHIVQVLGTGFTSHGLPYVVMELFERGSIADRIRTQGTYSAAETIDIGIKISDAAEAAHQAGVLHRDIKPQNVLVSEYGPALADFGIARSATNLEWSQSLDQITPMHAPPEVLLGEGPTARSDVYSIGSTLYTMLAGRPPHAGPPGETLLQYQVRAAQGVVPDIARTDVPRALVAVIMTALAKDPADRYGSPGELRDALKHLDGEPDATSAQSASPFAPVETPVSPFAPPAGRAEPLIPNASAPAVTNDLGSDLTVNRSTAGTTADATTPRVATSPTAPVAAEGPPAHSPWALGLPPAQPTTVGAPASPTPFQPQALTGSDRVPPQATAPGGTATAAAAPAGGSPLPPIDTAPSPFALVGPQHAPTPPVTSGSLGPFDSIPERFDASSTVLRGRATVEEAALPSTPERTGPPKVLIGAIAGGLVLLLAVAGVILASSGKAPTVKVAQTTYDAALAPLNLTIKPGGGGTLATLSWTSPNPGNVGFSVEQAPGGSATAGTGTSTVYNATGLTPGQGVCFLVVGFKNGVDAVGGACACLNQGKPTLPSPFTSLTCSQS